MSGFRVPVFFGSLLVLVVLILQNRTPDFQLTLLGMRSQPLSLGILVTIAVVAGVILGSILQRVQSRRAPSQSRPQRSTNSTSYVGPAELQPFRSEPASVDDLKDRDENDRSQNSAVDPDLQPRGSTRSKGWDLGASKSWTEQAEQVEQEGRFWSQGDEKKQRGSVTPIQARRSKRKPSPDDTNPSVVDAEYRIVKPTEPNDRFDDGFDDNFFDDFFEEEDS